MKKFLSHFPFFVGLTIVAVLTFPEIKPPHLPAEALAETVPTSSAALNAPSPTPSTTPSKVSLPVPFLWEIPDGVWVPPWSGACEESSVLMVEQFYLGRKNRSYGRTEAKDLIWPLFGIEDRLFGGNLDTNSTRTLKLINDYTAFDAKIKLRPTLDDIKTELAAGRPVISLHYGRDLKNPHHRWRQGGSSYHMMAIVGYDEKTEEFIVNDPELKDGIDLRYKYDIILSSLRDFNHTTKKADGTPVVLFTKPKEIVKARGGSRIFLVRDGVKHYISNPAVFKNHRWSWSLVKEVDPKYLKNLPSGPAITR